MSKEEMLEALADYITNDIFQYHDIVVVSFAWDAKKHEATVEVVPAEGEDDDND